MPISIRLVVTALAVLVSTVLPLRAATGDEVLVRGTAGAAGGPIRLGDSVSVSYFPGRQAPSDSEGIASALVASLQARGFPVKPAGSADWHLFYGVETDGTAAKKGDPARFLGLLAVPGNAFETPDVEKFVWKGQVRPKADFRRAPADSAELLRRMAALGLHFFGISHDWAEFDARAVEGDPRLYTLAFRTLARLNATSSKCPARLSRDFGPSAAQVCGKMDKDPSGSLSALEGVVDDLINGRAGGRAMGEWDAKRSTAKRHFFFVGRYGAILRFSGIDIRLDLRKGAVAAVFQVGSGKCVDWYAERSAVDGKVEPPNLVHRVHATYPEQALAARESGFVVAQVTVRADGSVSDVCLEGASPAGLGFEEATIEAINQWRYRPLTVDGEPVPFSTSVDMTFYMK